MLKGLGVLIMDREKFRFFWILILVLGMMGMLFSLASQGASDTEQTAPVEDTLL
jgi:hypothetical protein